MFKRRTPRTFFQQLRQLLWPREGWLRAGRYLWQRTIRLSGSPHDIALGLAIGAFVSANPIIGTHILWAAAIVYFIGGNFIAAMLGTWVGNPLTFPLIWPTVFNLGNWILGSYGDSAVVEGLSFSLLVNAPLDSLVPIIGPMFVGWIPVGFVLGILVYYPSYWRIEAYQKQRRERLKRKRAAARKKR